MTTQTVIIPSLNGQKLKGKIRIPNGNGPFPAVLFVAGLGMTMHEWNNSFDEIADSLREQGIASLEFQFPIFLDRNVCLELPLMRRAAFTTTVLEWMCKQKNIDNSRIGIAAQSYGVITVLCMDTSTVKSVVFISGAWFPEHAFAEIYRQKGVTINYEGETSLPRSSGENTTVGKEFWEDIKQLDTICLAKRISMPVMVVHGIKDSKIPATDVQRIFALIPNTHKKLVLYQDGDHGITDVPRSTRQAFVQEIVTWFTKTL